MSDTGEETEKDADGGGKRSKVERVIESYGLVGHGDRLVQYWTGDGEEQRSTRELAKWFNQEILRAAIEKSDRNVLSGEVENFYRLLTDDDVSRGNRTQTALELERAGVDVEKVQKDFVSHQTIYNYLTDVRGVKQSSGDDTPDIETIRSRVQRLRSRTQSVTKSGIESLVNADILSLGSFTVTVQIAVYCEDCGKQLDLLELFELRQCDCTASH